MGKSKKQKNYDIYISPGKRYLFRTRKILFSLSVATYILNMSLIAAFDDSMRKEILIPILLAVFFAVIQLADNRKAHWSWCYIIVLSAVFLLFLAVGVFVTELIFMRYIWVGELAFLCGFTLLSLRKKNKS